MLAFVLFTVMLILWCIYCILYKLCHLERTGQTIAQTFCICTKNILSMVTEYKWKEFYEKCLMKVVATMTLSHYNLPNLILNVYKQGHYVWQLYLTFFSQALLEHPAVYFIGSVIAELSLKNWVGRCFHLLSHLSTIQNYMLYIVTWQRFQDVYMDLLTSAQDFRVVTFSCH